MSLLEDNPPVLTESARETLRKALSAMESIDEATECREHHERAYRNFCRDLAKEYPAGALFIVGSNAFDLCTSSDPMYAPKLYKRTGNVFAVDQGKAVTP